jgi:hypothetical protein
VEGKVNPASTYLSLYTCYGHIVGIGQFHFLLAATYNITVLVAEQAAYMYVYGNFHNKNNVYFRQKFMHWHDEDTINCKTITDKYKTLMAVE